MRQSNQVQRRVPLSGYYPWSETNTINFLIFRFLSILAFVMLVVPSPVFSESSAIGLMTELSGTFAASGGHYCRQGYELARNVYAPGDTLGSRSVRFVYADSRGSGKHAVSAYRKLVDIDHVLGVVSNRSQVVMAINPLSARQGVPLIGIAGHPGFLKSNPNGFRFWPSATLESSTLAKKTLSLGHRKASVISMQDEWMLAFREMFKKVFLSSGGLIGVDEVVT